MPRATKPSLRAALHDAAGLTTVEYVIVLSLIAAAAVGTWQTFGDTVVGWLQGAEVEIGGALHRGEKPPMDE